MPEWSPQVFVGWDAEQSQRVAELLHGEQGPLRAVTVRAAREIHKLQGRGIWLAVFRDATLKSLQPPIYLTLERWERTPLFPQFEVLRTLREYNPDREFLQLAIGPHPDPQFFRIGMYEYWIVPFTEREMQS